MQGRDYLGGRGAAPSQTRELAGHFRVSRSPVRFVDLFAGLGGFHLALAGLGHQCVMAAEVDAGLAELYEANHGIRPIGDLRYVDPKDVPEHEVLCAGFPCQPFSKAGEQLGREHPGSTGTLFDNVLQILEVRRPPYVILENVPNLLRHNGGRTWVSMRRGMELLGYDVRESILSPHMFGVPQARDRAIIVGKMGKDSLRSFAWPGESRHRDDLDLRAILDERPKDAKKLPPTFESYLDAWQKFLDIYPVSQPLPSFPIWAMEFGATYPFEGVTPFGSGANELSACRGSFGEALTGIDGGWNALPAYARNYALEFPRWKERFIRQNRDLYALAPAAFDAWMPMIRGFAPSFQKLEWNWQDGPRDIRAGVIQFRASGIRVKRPTVAPSLVALTTSQVPVIPWESRYMTARECARLQSMEGLRHLPSTRQAAFRALGNAVNVRVIEAVAARLLKDVESPRLAAE